MRTLNFTQAKKVPDEKECFKIGSTNTSVEPLFHMPTPHYTPDYFFIAPFYDRLNVTGGSPDS